jgi:DNA uptake protein ComE-like DNA-binding protein
MTRLIAVFVALLFAAGAVAAPIADAGGAATTAPAKGEESKGKDAGKEPAKKKLDINSASAEELMTLPGIGEALSKKIIEGRGKDGYKRKDELVKRKIIPEPTYKKIQAQIIAKQVTAKKDPAPAAAAAPAPAASTKK